MPESQSRIRGQPGPREDDAESGALLTRGTVAPVPDRAAVADHDLGVRAVQERGDPGQGRLPQPLGPRRPTASPGWTVRVASRTTGVRWSYPAVMARSSSMGVLRDVRVVAGDVARQGRQRGARVGRPLAARCERAAIGEVAEFREHAGDGGEVSGGEGLEEAAPAGVARAEGPPLAQTLGLHLGDDHETLLDGLLLEQRALSVSLVEQVLMVRQNIFGLGARRL
ncbi:hypothetical protein AQJ46_11640 [Streptomyces canus]|uniref:Uncharacterized protein n=1 Tax=Streptomyces canus TaxID=58343 RepID=A0A101SF10_9ACTN|nr:hypothetical protein AQJ46_11640 [Streptomyces canus]